MNTTTDHRSPAELRTAAILASATMVENLAELVAAGNRGSELHEQAMAVSRCAGSFDPRKDARNAGSAVAYLVGRLHTAGSAGLPAATVASELRRVAATLRAQA